MKRSIVRTIPIQIAAALILAGCAGVEKPKPVPVKPISSSAYKMKALEYEKNRNLTKALDYWKITVSIDPSDAKSKGKVALVEAISKSFARTHFKKGVTYYKKRRFKNARKEFMIALRYDPQHKQALNYLKNKFTRSVYRSYQVRKGDTFNRIAGKMYKDPDKGFLIASINKLAFKKKPRPGTILNIPRLNDIKKATPTTKAEPSDVPAEPDDSDQEVTLNPIIDIENELTNARNYFTAKNYAKVLPITQTILENDPLNSEALKLKNRAYLSMGKELMLKKKYVESLNMFSEADTDFEGAQEAVIDLKKQMRLEAEEHYRRGVKQFLNEELNMAIEEWEQTLVLNPDHAKAQKDIENARNLLEKFEKVQ